MIKKSEFVRSLQGEPKILSPSDISQRLRITSSCVSVCQLDPGLDPADYRGYMLKYGDKPNRTPEDPELYCCVVSARQSMAWQYVIWIKEILGILDPASARTDNKQKLIAMLKNRTAASKNDEAIEPHVAADKNGFILALGCTIPKAYRSILRNEEYLERYSLESLEKLLFVPDEFVKRLLEEKFEEKFEEALRAC